MTENPGRRTRRPRRTRRGARPLTLLATALVTACALAAAPLPAHADAATVTCATPTVPVYHVDDFGQMRRWSYPAPLDGSGAAAWTQQVLGSGWSGLNVVSGGDGVLYTIDGGGDLRWYKDDGAYTGGSDVDWDPGSGSLIGTGWSRFTRVFSAGQGVIYAIDSSGALYWYAYQGTAGSAVWAPNSGTVVGSSWGALSRVFSGGDGIVFAVNDAGTLYWYRHQNPAAGAATWDNGGSGIAIGNGWAQFTDVGSVGGGVLFARDPSGALWWYRDTDPLGGTPSWANGGTGLIQGSGWGPAQVLGDVTACAAA